MNSFSPLGDIARKEEIEVEYWRTSETEKPEAESIRNLVNKLTEASVFLSRLDHYRRYFAASSRILEIGAGQGWAAHIVKREYPDAYVIATDISPYAIASCHKWERVFGAGIDEARACKSYELPFDDSSIDLVYAFQSAHHFVRHERTLREIHRVLRPGGRALYIYEPACRPYIHGLAHRRVNRKRPAVPEDVLVYPELIRLAAHVGFKPEVVLTPSISNRGERETLYYLILGLVPGLKHLLPCTADFLFEKV
jgi:SAM-dependent methyltransferase